MEAHKMSRPYTKPIHYDTCHQKWKMQPFSLGMKFSTGIRKGDVIDTIVRDPKLKDTNFGKGLIQGIVTATRRR